MAEAIRKLADDWEAQAMQLSPLTTAERFLRIQLAIELRNLSPALQSLDTPPRPVADSEDE